MMRENIIDQLKRNPTYVKAINLCAPEERERISNAAEATCAILFESLSCILSGSNAQKILTFLKNEASDARK